MKTKKKGYRKGTFSLFLIALPGILYLFINNYVPIMGIFIAFKRFSYAKGIWDSPWCGFDNFKFLFITDDAWVITRNTLLYNLAFIIIGTIISVFMAILLNELGEKLRGKFFQSTLLFPHLLSWVVTSYLVYALLGATNGFVNNTILAGMGKEGIDWYSVKMYWPLILILVYIWKNAGYTAIVYMAGIAGIDNCDYYDSDVYRKNFLFGFWVILSGTDEQRNAVFSDTDDRYLCIQGTDGAGKYRYVVCGRSLSVTGRIYSCDVG